MDLPKDILAFRIFGRRYKTIQRIGLGGRCSVYKGIIIGEEKKETKEQEIAIKIWEPKEADRRDGAKEEWSIVWSRIKEKSKHCTNLPNLYDKGEEGLLCYSAEELLQEAESVLEPGKMEDSVIRMFIKDVTNALKNIHECGCIHGDVSPKNVMIRKTMNDKLEFVLIDFDASYLIDSSLFRYKGAARYAPILRHLNIPIASIRNDLEMFLYVIVECKVGHLPWKSYHFFDDIGKCKISLIGEEYTLPTKYPMLEGKSKLPSLFPEPFGDLWLEIVSLPVDITPEDERYKQIIKKLENFGKENESHSS